MARKDLSPFGLAKGQVRKLSKVIGFADLTAEAGNMDVACGTIPSGALILGVEVKIAEAFNSADAADTWDLDDITIGGTEIGLDTRVDEDTSLDAVGTFTGSVFMEASGAVLANIEVTPNVANNVDDATEGSLTLKIYYVEDSVEQPS